MTVAAEIYSTSIYATINIQPARANQAVGPLVRALPPKLVRWGRAKLEVAAALDDDQDKVLVSYFSAHKTCCESTQVAGAGSLGLSFSGARLELNSSAICRSVNSFVPISVFCLLCGALATLAVFNILPSWIHYCETVEQQENFGQVEARLCIGGKAESLLSGSGCVKLVEPNRWILFWFP